MKVIGYLNAHNIDSFEMKEFELDHPELGPHDILVKIMAIGVNPVDYKIRQGRSSKTDRPVVIGWDASGRIEEMGSEVTNVSVGDEVFYAGDITKDGSYAELQTIDSRLVGKKPKTLDFAQSAAIPLTAITAYEALIEQSTTQYSKNTSVLIIGGAGGVGSMSLQLLKALTPATVIATASRDESIKWCQDLGADYVINHRNNLSDELKKIGFPQVDFVFSTNHTEQYISILPDIIKPFGQLTLIDDPESFDMKPFKAKSIKCGYEFMFTKSMFHHKPEEQGQLLTKIGELIDRQKIRTTMSSVLTGLTAENVKTAHEALESGRSVGKTVIALD